MIKKIFLSRICDIIIASNDDVNIWDRIISAIKSIGTLTPVSLVMSGLGLWFENNLMFFTFTIISILINMGFGGWMHWSKGTFSLETLLYKNIKMTFIVLVSYMMLEFIAQIMGIDNTIGEIFEKTIQIATLLYPVGKVLKNLFILSDGKHPPEFIMKKIYNFQKTGDLKDFIEFKQQKQEEYEKEI